MSTLKAIFAPVPEIGPERRLGPRPLDRFDRWTLGLIAVVFLLLLASIGHLKPAMSDTWYHLVIAKQLLADGQVPGWDRWHYAPLGRPNLYPPLLHLLLAALAHLTGSLVRAGQLCAVLFLPCGFLTTWYCVRRLLSPRLALLAVLILLTDLFHFVVMDSYIAACFINLLLPLLMVSFLARRPWWSILLLTLMYYAHLGFPHCVALGLILFGLKYRSYLRLALKVVGVSLLFFTPWLAHVLGNLEWLEVLREGGVPGTLLQKVLSLQILNLVLLGLGLWGISRTPRSEPARRLPVYLLAGFLPILFSYGGRYAMHTMPLWALLGAGVIGPLLPATAPARRILGLMLLTLLPLPSITVGKADISVLPLTGVHALLMTTFGHNSLFADPKKSEAYLPDCDRLADWLRKNTDPQEIIHVNTVWVADMISLLADRRTDSGAWWECSKQSAKLYGQALRDWAPRAVFVCIKPEADVSSIIEDTPKMPGVDRKLDFGRMEVGLRDPHAVRPADYARLGPWRALAAPGAAATVRVTSTGLVWRLPVGEGKLSLVSAPADLAGAGGSLRRLDGLAFRLRADKMTGDLVLGVRLTDGQDLRWPLAVPEPKVLYRVRALVRWMTDAEGRPAARGRDGRLAPVCEVYFARAPDKIRPGKKRETLQVEITDLQPLAER